MSLGRYLSPEPLLQDPRWVASELRRGRQVPAYAYAGNNPIANVDPNGLFFGPVIAFIAEWFGVGTAATVMVHGPTIAAGAAGVGGGLLAANLPSSGPGAPPMLLPAPGPGAAPSPSPGPVCGPGGGGGGDGFNCSDASLNAAWDRVLQTAGGFCREMSRWGHDFYIRCFRAELETQVFCDLLAQCGGPQAKPQFRNQSAWACGQ